MPSAESQSPLRQPFFDADATEPEASHARDVLRLLMAQDGSTTRLCETVAGGPVQLLLHHQAPTGQVPASVAATLPGSQFIERCTSLVAHGEVLMDNLTYIALEGLPPDVQSDLLEGQLPIGHLLARLWVRRRALPDAGGALHQRLTDWVGVPDAAATRSYSIVTPEGPRMVICETYRRGMLMRPGQGSAAA